MILIFFVSQKFQDAEVEQLCEKRELEQHSQLRSENLEYEQGVDDEEWFWIWV